MTSLRYQAGESTAQEVVDAQNALITSRNSYDDAQARYRLAISVLQTLTGEDPGDVEPFDTESITEVLIEYRRWANRAKPGCIRSDEKSQKPSISAAPRLSEAIEWAISEVGHPARDVPLKTFCAKVWERCGVDPGAKGYSSRTIRRLVANRRN